MLWKELLLEIVSVVLVNASPKLTTESTYGKHELVILMATYILIFFLKHRWTGSWKQVHMFKYFLKLTFVAGCKHWNFNGEEKMLGHMFRNILIRFHWICIAQLLTPQLSKIDT